VISKLHRFLVCVLLVLLPLQATAVVTICPHSKLTAAASEFAPAPTMEHCQHGQAGNAGLIPDDSGEPRQSEQNQQSCCATVSACAMCSIAVNLQQAPKVGRLLQLLNYFLSSQYSSFIPEGLQRPPSILA